MGEKKRAFTGKERGGQKRVVNQRPKMGGARNQGRSQPEYGTVPKGLIRTGGGNTPKKVGLVWVGGKNHEDPATLRRGVQRTGGSKNEPGEKRGSCWGNGRPTQRNGAKEYSGARGKWERKGRKRGGEKIVSRKKEVLTTKKGVIPRSQWGGFGGEKTIRGTHVSCGPKIRGTN